MVTTTNVLGGGVAFNEWRPSSTSVDYNGDCEAFGEEDTYIEIVNTSDAAIDIGGYKFNYFESGQGAQAVAHTVPNGVVLQPGETYTLV